MSEKLLEIQTLQWHCAMSLLGQEFCPTLETGGSAFYVDGTAAFISTGPEY